MRVVHSVWSGMCIMIASIKSHLLNDLGPSSICLGKGKILHHYFSNEDREYSTEERCYLLCSSRENTENYLEDVWQNGLIIEQCRTESNWI